MENYYRPLTFEEFIIIAPGKMIKHKNSDTLTSISEITRQGIIIYKYRKFTRISFESLFKDYRWHTGRIIGKNIDEGN